MKLGWLIDTQHGYKGGAELCSDELLRTKPDDIKVVLMSPGAVHNNVDGFIIHNCTEYGSYILPMLETRPVIKYVHDVWPHGDPVLKKWLCQHSKLMILSSPLHREALNLNIGCPVKLLPNAINADLFNDATRAKFAQVQKPACWLGRFETFKGLQAAAEWAAENGIVLDWYGYGPALEMVEALGTYCGKLRPDQVPEVLSQYQTFVFLPDEVEPYSRTTVEAWLAGCELVVNGNIGAVWWLENEPEAVTRGAEMFWETIRTVIT